MNFTKTPTRRSTLLDPEEPIGTSSEHAPRRTRWDLDAEKIIHKLKKNRTFKAGMDFEVEGLPVFGAMSQYGVSEETELELFSLEIRRLVDAVNSGAPIQLEHDPDWFGLADRDGYGRLDKLAWQLRQAISICFHDLELMMLEYYPVYSRPDHFRKARETLLETFDPDSPRDPASTCNDMRLKEHNNKAFHALVDYLTSTITQVLLRTMQGEFWDDNCIITMARCTTMIKVVSMDLVRAAETSLAAKREWAARMKRNADHEPSPPVFEDEKKKDKEKTPFGKQQQALEKCVVLRAPRYFQVMHAFSNSMLVLLLSISRAICPDPGTTLPPDVFESTSIVFDTGFRGHRSLLCQEKSGGIGASGNRDEVHCASFAFEVCLEAFEDLARRTSPSNRLRTGDSEPSTLVYWKWTEMRTEGDGLHRGLDTFKGESRTDQRELSSMSDVITALIPYLTVCGTFSCEMAAFTRLIMSIPDHGDPVSMCAETRFIASFMVQTSKYDAFSEKAAQDSRDVTSVSKNPIAEKRALAQGPMSSDLRNRGMSDEQLREGLLHRTTAISKALEVMDRWTFDRSSIIIRSRWYCWGTLACCAVLVVGGLVIGFTVNKRIDGVDPFNISVFCWVLAGFVIVFMKSLRVENWPWRDFFNGKVVCRSVSEVSAVSGIDEQLFLSILLRLEPIIIMNKEGPFRSIFRRVKSDAVGFSIDIPLERESLVDAGCFFIRVESMEGPALVCIRATNGIPYNAVRPHSISREGEHDKCRDIREPHKWGRGGAQKDMYPLCTNHIRWSRVVGLYWGDAYFC